MFAKTKPNIYTRHLCVFPSRPVETVLLTALTTARPGPQIPCVGCIPLGIFFFFLLFEMDHNGEVWSCTASGIFFTLLMRRQARNQTTPGISVSHHVVRVWSSNIARKWWCSQGRRGMRGICHGFLGAARDRRRWL